MTVEDSLPWRGHDPADLLTAHDRDAAHRAFLEVVTGRLPAWRQRAACIGTPVNVFFPTKGQRPDPRARQVCQGCTVRAECLDDALDDPHLDHGYRAGLSPRQRKAERARRTPGASRSPAAPPTPEDPAPSEICLSETESPP